ncbi:MAG: Gfo/Idh/MocA family oxidoreductase [Bacteroidia bacterium]|nr:Gfo/Idh/MocA family oxidoreductase [Bacteroidia bacterium]
MIPPGQPIHFGIIGAGHIGKRHAAMIRNHPEAVLSAVCDIRPREATGFADLSVPYYDSHEAMLAAHPELDVVVVATPNGLHEPHAIAVLEARKHAVIEKPMALTKQGAERIIFKALQMSKQAFCVMQNRYSPPSAWLKDVVERELLGRIYLVQINCYWNRDDRYYQPGSGSWKGSRDLDGGTLFTQFSHFIDILYWLFGDITDIRVMFEDFAHRHSTEFEDTGLVHFRLINGGVGTLSYSTAVWDTNLESSLTVIGEKGAVKVGGQYMNEVVYCHIQDYEMPVLPPANPPNDYGPYKGSAANHHYIIENVVDTLKGRTTATTNALEGLKVVEMIERIYSREPFGKHGNL